MTAVRICPGVFAKRGVVMKTKEEIEEKIATLEKAMAMDGFVPSPDGRKLQEHLYYRRLGALDYLRWAIDFESDK